jgi:ABC-type polysaccharide/polyol phosphate transport system ATPase subunit
MKKKSKNKLNVTNNIAIQLTNVSKKYEIHHEKPTLVEKFVKGRTEIFWALKDINITIYKGEKVGIIGPNGSGKTTLLKIIAQITTSSCGKVKTYGRVVSLIDLEAGFHYDLTGIQNIFLNGMLLGMKKDEIEKKLASIISFADIKQFIDAPLFTYSEGMKLRLGFSIAIHSNPDVLILDEGMAVGDTNFQKKTLSKIQELFYAGKTVIVVTHWLEFVENNCDRVYVFKEGKIVREGRSREVIRYYQNAVIK